MRLCAEFLDDLRRAPIEVLKRIEGRGQHVLSIMKGLTSIDMLPVPSTRRKSTVDSSRTINIVVTSREISLFENGKSVQSIVRSRSMMRSRQGIIS